jgi:hypothetical protein
MARTPGYIGARAFSRSGYPELGHYEPAEVLMRCGSFYWSPKDGAWIV